MSLIQCICPVCDAQIPLSQNLVGERIRCPNCKQRIPTNVRGDGAIIFETEIHSFSNSAGITHEKNKFVARHRMANLANIPVAAEEEELEVEAPKASDLTPSAPLSRAESDRKRKPTNVRKTLTRGVTEFRTQHENPRARLTVIGDVSGGARFNFEGAQRSKFLVDGVLLEAGDTVSIDAEFTQDDPHFPAIYAFRGAYSFVPSDVAAESLKKGLPLVGAYIKEIRIESGDLGGVFAHALIDRCYIEKLELGGSELVKGLTIRDSVIESDLVLRACAGGEGSDDEEPGARRGQMFGGVSISDTLINGSLALNGFSIDGSLHLERFFVLGGLSLSSLDVSGGVLLRDGEVTRSVEFEEVSTAPSEGKSDAGARSILFGRIRAGGDFELANLFPDVPMQFKACFALGRFVLENAQTPSGIEFVRCAFLEGLYVTRATLRGAFVFRSSIAQKGLRLEDVSANRGADVRGSVLAGSVHAVRETLGEAFVVKRWGEWSKLAPQDCAIIGDLDVDDRHLKDFSRDHFVVDVVKDGALYSRIVSEFFADERHETVGIWAQSGGQETANWEHTIRKSLDRSAEVYRAFDGRLRVASVTREDYQASSAFFCALFESLESAKRYEDADWTIFENYKLKRQNLFGRLVSGYEREGFSEKTSAGKALLLLWTSLPMVVYWFFLLLFIASVYQLKLGAAHQGVLMIEILISAVVLFSPLYLPWNEKRALRRSNPFKYVAVDLGERRKSRGGFRYGFAAKLKTFGTLFFMSIVETTTGYFTSLKRVALTIAIVTGALAALLVGFFAIEEGGSIGALLTSESGTYVASGVSGALRALTQFYQGVRSVGSEKMDTVVQMFQFVFGVLWATFSYVAVRRLVRQNPSSEF
ncbi:MAG: hypothetical protein NUW37_06770 [Planctomycetes bacterium]|nr:hypothetical protein [Planctomycetota bacterium]